MLSAALVTFGCAAGGGRAFAYGSALPCTTRDTSTAFARWLDPARYFLASNGGFEQGATDWQLSSGATVGAGNEPFNLAGATDTHSLELTGGASAESRRACVTMGEPTVRLLVKTPDVRGAVLRIDASVFDPTTGLTVNTTYLIDSRVMPAGWAPTPEIVIGNAAGGVVPEDLTLRITAGGTPATWAVDDVYVDPYKQR